MKRLLISLALACAFGNMAVAAEMTASGDVVALARTAPQALALQGLDCNVDPEPIVAMVTTNGYDPSNSTIFVANLEAAGFTVRELDLTGGNIPDCVTKLYISSESFNACLQTPFGAVEEQAIVDWVFAGGEAFINGEWGSDQSPGCGIGTESLIEHFVTAANIDTLANGPFVDGVDFDSTIPATATLFAGVGSYQQAAGSHFVDAPGSPDVVVADPDPVMVAGEAGSGCVVITGDSNWMSDPFIVNADNEQLASNAIAFINECSTSLRKELTSGPDRDGSAIYPDFSDVTGLTLNGSAAQAGSVLRLTPAVGSQVGSAFTTNPVDLGPDASFSTHFSFAISNPGGAGDLDGIGADGITFVLHNDPSGDLALGPAGGALGYYDGIASSFAVEYDSWNNAPFLGDPDGNHVGTAANGVAGPAVPVGPPRLNDGATFYAWIDYDGVADIVEVRLSTNPVRPVAPTLTHAGVDLEAILGGTIAYLGFTSGTGAAWGDHDILSWHYGGGIDLVVPVGELVPTAYDFTITYNDPDYPDVVIEDRVPAEWDVTHVEFDDTGLPLDCGEDITFVGVYGTVDLFRGGKANKSCNSDTGLFWTPGDDNTLNVQTLARCHDNKKNEFCRPTSCGALYLNYGAVAFEKDPVTGELVLDQFGDPIMVAGPTDPICLAAVEDLDGDGTFEWDGTGDEDGDGLTDYFEACEFPTFVCDPDSDDDGVLDGDEVDSGCMDPLDPDTDDDGLTDGEEIALGTDPCDPDTDDDGVPDGADACPLEGPADPALGQILEPDGCIRQSQCSDGVDNDGDGPIDFPDDFSCTDILDDSEDFADPAACTPDDCSDGSVSTCAVGPGGGNCYCFATNPSITEGVCVDNFFCSGAEDCSSDAGICAPLGKVCLYDTCCGPAVCGPVQCTGVIQSIEMTLAPGAATAAGR